MKNLKQLREERAQKIEAMQALNATASSEKRSFNADEKTNFDALENQIAELDGDIRRAETLEKLAISAISAGQGTNHGLNDNDKRDISSYSILRAVNAKINDQPLSGIEAEMHQEAVKQYRDAGLQIQGNLLIPQNVLALAGSARSVNATGGTGGDQGGVNIATATGSIIERLRAKLVVAGMGATMLDGLVGNITFPKFLSDDQAADKAENATSNASSPTFGSVSLSPRRLPVHVEVSRQLLLQTSNSIESMLRDDLAFQIAKVMDASAITAILNEAGIGSVAGGANGLAPTWENIIALETAIATANAEEGTLGYLTNPKVRGKLKGTQKFSGTNGSPVFESGATPLNGYRAGISTQVPSNLTKGTSSGVCSALIFGNFKDLLMGQWGGIEFLVNPYAKDTEGLVRINAWTFYDEAIRNAQSFAAMKDALTV
jgi:HK97 family phage major capsid protein